jgi:Circularly permutated YpsA SLOG family
MIDLVISGGQRGVDQAGWRAARAVGLPTGGWMPKGFRTEGQLRSDGTVGPDESHPEFEELYGAKEHSSRRYEDRTPLNVQDADVTLLIGDTSSPGSRLAYRCFRKKIGERGLDPGIVYIRPGWVAVARHTNWTVFSPHDVADILARMPHGVVNVAGNRESSHPGIGEWSERFLDEVFRLLQGA